VEEDPTDQTSRSWLRRSSGRHTRTWPNTFGSESAVRAKEDSGWLGVFMLLGLTAGVIVYQFTYFALAEAAAASVVITLWAARHFDWWSDRRLYWLFIAAIAAAHIALLVAVPWPRRHLVTRADGIILAPDIGLVLLAGELLRRSARLPPRSTSI
jgi:hypothetical protein